MQKKSYSVNFGDAVTVFPKKAVKKIIKGDATLEEIRVLAALMASDSKATEIKLCTQTGLDDEQVAEALCFWRGVGVITCDGTVSEKHAEEAESNHSEAKNTPFIAPTTQETSLIEATDGGDKDYRNDKKILPRDLPKYTGLEISAMLDEDGGKLREMIDSCQQLIGHIFTPTEVNRMVSLCSWLGLEAEYVVTLVAYYVEKKPKCNVAYIEKTAIDLVNDGITALDDLDVYIKDRELYDGISGKIRSIAGIGGREFTKKENNFINHWTKELGYDFDIIKFAYEICCDTKGEFKFGYVNTVLENWYKAGVKTVENAEAENKKYADQKYVKTTENTSFDTTEFFGAALKRTYQSMAKKADNGENK